jgi:hypothetical protein
MLSSSDDDDDDEDDDPYRRWIGIRVSLLK